MGVEFLKANMTAGELAPTLHARTDISKYANGVAEATNMIILPHGGMRRRPGLSVIDDTKLSGATRMLPFVFNTEQDYLIVLAEYTLYVLKDGVLQSTETIPYTESELFELEAIQSADTMIFVHKSHAPRYLQRQGSDTNWAFTTISFDNIPRKNFGATVIEKYVNAGYAQTINIRIGDIVLNRDGNDTNGINYTYYTAETNQDAIDLSIEDFTSTTNWTQGATMEAAWSSSRGYPQTATFFGNRLWMAGTPELPTTIWGSKINGFFDFDLGDGEADMGIEDILDTDQYNEIQTIFAGRSLQVFTSGGEFFNKATVITPSESSWSRQTGYGSINIKPLLIDGSTIFIDSSGRTVRQFLYDFNEDSMVSINASLLSSHLITNVVAMDAIKGTQYDVGDYVYVIDEGGTVAVLNTMRREEIQGWTHWETDGLFKDVCVLGKEVYFLVERNGTNFIELLTEETYTDHNKIVRGTKPTETNVVQFSDNVEFNTDNVIYTNFSTGTPVTSIDTDYSSEFLTTMFKVIADYSVMPNATPTGTANNNSFTITRDAYRLEIGLNYTTKVVTLPIATETQKGSTLHRRKRVVKVDINVVDSLGVYARNRFTPDRSFTVVLDTAPQPYTGFKEMYLLGYNRLAEIEISQAEPLPFLLRAIAFEVEY